MDRSISLWSQIIVLGVLICLTSATSLRQKRNVIAGYHWPEPDPEIDQFPHESSCHHYYLVLSEEDITVHKCPHGELFDYKEHICKEKESAKCWSKHFGKKTNHHTLLQSNGPFTCPYAWGKYPDTNNCTNYYVCLNGKVKHKKCASFEHFDKVSRKCVAAIEGVCADNTDVVEPTYKCPRSWGSYTYHKDCSKYYECLEKKPSLRTCPAQTLFHDKRHKCVPRHHVHCGSRHNPYSKKEVTNTIDKTSSISEDTSEPSKTTIEMETKQDVKISTVEVKVGTVSTSEDSHRITSEPSKKTGDKEIKPNVKSSTAEVKAETISTSEDSQRITSEPNETTVDEKNKVDAKITSEKEIKADAKITSEKEIKADAKITSEKEIKAIEKLLSTNVPQETLLKSSLTTEESSSSVIEAKASTPTTENLDITKASTKQTISEKTVPEMKPNALKNVPGNESDEVEDSNEEFIEVSTDSQSSSVADSQPTAIVSASEKIQTGSTLDKADQDTTIESIQATPSEECKEKDPTCIVEDGGRVIRCPQPDGIYPYPEDERRFLHCKSGEIGVRYCPGETIFSFQAKKCIGKLIF